MWRTIVKCSRALFSSTKLSIHPEEISSQSVPLITLNWVLKDYLHCPALVLNGHSDETKNNLAFYISFYNACPDYLSDVLSGRPDQSLQPSFMALSFRAIFLS